MSISHASLADTAKLVIVRSSIVPTCPFGQCPFVRLQFGAGFTEGENNVVGAVKRRAYGFRNFSNLRRRILLEGT